MNLILNYLWAIIWTIAMMVLLLMPPSDLPSGNFFDGFDKLVHTGSFYLFTILVLYGRLMNTKNKSSKLNTFFVVLIISSLFAFFTEGAQMYFTSTRQGDWWDIFADYVGIGMALFSYLLLYKPKVSFA